MGDPALDRHCRIAKAALRADAILFAVVEEERQFFPSQIGLAEPYAKAGQTPITHSFCKLVVEGSETLVIADTAAEPLVVDNPARHDLGIASYLGVPVRDEYGTVLGAVCSTTVKVREWTTADVHLLTDVAASIEDELRIRARTKRLEARLSDEQLTQDYSEALSQISVATNRLQTIQGVSDELAARVAPAIGAEITSIAIVENGQLQFTHGSGVSPSVAQAWTVAPIDAQIPMAAAVSSGHVVHLEDRAAFAAYPGFDDAADKLGLGSFRAIPFGDEALGLFGVLGIGWQGPMPEADVPSALDRIVELAKSTLTRAWNFEVERNQARILERVVLPTSLPATSVYSVAGVYVAPDTGQRVGGDVYDVIVRPDGAVGVMIADAVGHDLTATRAAARLRHAVGVLIMEDYSPAEVMTAVNRYVSASPSKRLVTCVCLLFAADGSSVTIANAGHPQPILRSSTGTAFIGPVGETLLGRDPIRYSEETIPIAEGEFVLCFTDGLIDRRDRSFIESEQWLLDFIERQTDHDPHRVTESLQNQMSNWAIDDDVAFLVVSRRMPSDRVELRWARPAGEIRLGDMRSEIKSWANEAGVGRSHDVSLVATELVTNARDASQPDDDVMFVAEQTADADDALAGVRLQVSNRTPPFPPPSGMPSSSSIRGRGLAVTEALTTSLTIKHAQGWVTVTAILSAEPSNP